MPKITMSAIGDLINQPRNTVIRDTDIKGFQAKRISNGVTFSFEYRAGRGRKAPVKRVKIGRHSGAMTPDQARKIAKDLSISVALDKDPAAERATAKGMPTLNEYAVKLMEDQRAVAIRQPNTAPIKLSTIKGYESYLNNHVGPALGGTKLDKITTAQIRTFHNVLSRTNPTLANRCLQYISVLFTAAAVEGYVPIGTRPTAGVVKNKENERERFLSDEEFALLGDVLRLAETTGLPYSRPKPRPGKKAKHIPINVKPYKPSALAIAAIRVLLLSGRRLREVLHSKWTDIDLDRGILTRMTKSGRKALILPAAAIEILRGLPRVSEHVFPSSTDPRKPMSDLNKPWRAIRRHAGLSDVRLHDLRHSFASVTVSGGASLYILGKLLGHSQSVSTQRYAHLADDPVRKELEKAAGKIGLSIGSKL